MESKTKKGLQLNVGCGGNSLYSFHDFGCDVRADLRPPTIRIDNFIVCDVTNLPFKSRAFTNIIASHLVEHLSNHQEVLKEMIRICSETITLFYPKFFFVLFNFFLVLNVPILNSLFMVFYLFGCSFG